MHAEMISLNCDGLLERGLDLAEQEKGRLSADPPAALSRLPRVNELHDLRHRQTQCPDRLVQFDKARLSSSSSSQQRLRFSG